MSYPYVTQSNDDRYYNGQIPTEVENYFQDKINPRIWHIIRKPCIHFKETECRVCPRKTVKKIYCLLKDIDRGLNCNECTKRVEPKPEV